MSVRQSVRGFLKMRVGSVKPSTLSRGYSSLPVKKDGKKKLYKFLISPSFLSTDPLLLLLLLHLLLLTHSSSLSFCLSSQQGGEARLTN